MKLKLPSGLEVELGIRHCWTCRDSWRKHVKEVGGEIYCKEPGTVYDRRVTLVWLKGVPLRDFAGTSTTEVEAVCSPKDNFCKKVGRKLAASKLIEIEADRITKEDRRAIFQAICPEYAPKKKPECVKATMDPKESERIINLVNKVLDTTTATG